MKVTIHRSLFKRNSDGTIQRWLAVSNGSRYRTHSGKYNGKMVVSKYTQCYGRNEGRSNARTPAEQCMFVVQSLYTKRIKAGYHKTVREALADVRVRPMLAHTFAKRLPLVEEQLEEVGFVWSQPKLDGVRCLVNINGMMSRGWRPIVSSPHIHEQLRKLFKEYPSLVLDGELYNHDYRDKFEDIISLVKKTKPTKQHLRESAEKVQFHVFDVWLPEADHERYGERHLFLQKILRGLWGAATPIQLVPAYKVSSLQTLDVEYRQLLRSGYEGQMVRFDEAPYEQKRTNNLLKRKEDLDEEFSVLDICEGSGNRSRMAGYAVLVTRDGKEFNASIMGEMATLKSYLRNSKKYIGGQATVRFKKYTQAGVPREPRVVVFHEGRRRL